MLRPIVCRRPLSVKNLNFKPKCSVHPLSCDNYRSFEYRMLKIKIISTLNNKEKISICTSYTGHMRSYQTYYKHVQTEHDININAEMIVDKIAECIYDNPDKFISIFSYNSPPPSPPSSTSDKECALDKLDSVYIVRLPQNYYSREGPIRRSEDLSNPCPYPW